MTFNILTNNILTNGTKKRDQRYEIKMPYHSELSHLELTFLDGSFLTCQGNISYFKKRNHQISTQGFSPEESKLFRLSD